MKTALVLLFPQCFYMDRMEADIMQQGERRGYKGTAELLDEFGPYVQRARERADSVYMLTASGVDGVMLPVSGRFLPCSSDRLVDTGAVFHVSEYFYLRHSIPIYSALVSHVKEDEVMVGGFHLLDCVAKFCDAAEWSGKAVLCCPYLTDFFFNPLCAYAVRGVDDWREVPEQVRHTELPEVFRPISYRVCGAAGRNGL